MSGCMVKSSGDINALLALDDRELNDIIAQARLWSSKETGKGVITSLVLVEAVTEWDIRHPRYLPPAMADLLPSVSAHYSGPRKVWQWPSESD